MKLLICSDIHGDFVSTVNAVADQPTANIILFLGDGMRTFEKLADLYMDGGMSKEMLDEKNGELTRRIFQIEEELEKRKSVLEADDIRPEDIENFIIQFVEDTKEDCQSLDDEFMRIMINVFVKRVDVSIEEVIVHIHTPFSRMDGGDNVCFGGVIHRLSPIETTRSFPRNNIRKNNIKDKNI